ncbi:MAG: D-alanyl-D-alanine carboxypeptidase [Clostridia bacterium]|nr:D-alanyl-D-alanine carboxypeptidase [Clostridia bacterium]
MQKHVWTGWAALLSALLLLAVPVTVAAEPVEQPTAATISAGAAVLYEPQTGRVLFEQNAHARRAIASTTKLMTALLAVERLSPDEDLIVPAQAVAVEGTTMGLHAGDAISRHDLLCGMLLESGNDAANTVALCCSGSYEAFAEQMNARAAALGMTKSLFVTPSGLDEGDHGASAFDMALLAAAVLQNEELAAICALKQQTVSFGNPKREAVMSNHNRLLSLYPDAIGLKTGYTSKAGRCLVSAARRDGVTLIAITLDCPDDWNEHIALYEAGFSLLTAVTPMMPPLPSVPVFGGTALSLALKADALPSVTVLKEDVQELDVSVELPAYAWAPVDAGQPIGWIRVTLRGEEIVRMPIVAEQTIYASERASWLFRAGRCFFTLFRRLIG